MAEYAIRAEFNNGEDEDWDHLHNALYKLKFYRVIEGTSGIWYDLPTGTYFGASTESTLEVRKTIAAAQEKIIVQRPKNKKGKQKTAEVVVIKSETWSSVLFKNTDSSKLPPGKTQKK